MRRPSIEPAPYTAVVHAADGVRFTASASSEAERSSHVLGYVCDRCDYTLWPEAAGEVRALVAAGDAEEAIAAYFLNVGERWDAEWLELAGPETRSRPAHPWRARATRPPAA